MINDLRQELLQVLLEVRYKLNNTLDEDLQTLLEDEVISLCDLKGKFAFNQQKDIQKECLRIDIILQSIDDESLNELLDSFINELKAGKVYEVYELPRWMGREYLLLESYYRSKGIYKTDEELLNEVIYKNNHDTK